MSIKGKDVFRVINNLFGPKIDLDSIIRDSGLTGDKVLGDRLTINGKLIDKDEVLFWGLEVFIQYIDLAEKRYYVKVSHSGDQVFEYWLNDLSSNINCADLHLSLPVFKFIELNVWKYPLKISPLIKTDKEFKEMLENDPSEEIHIKQPIGRFMWLVDNALDEIGGLSSNNRERVKLVVYRVVDHYNCPLTRTYHGLNHLSDLLEQFITHMDKINYPLEFLHVIILHDLLMEKGPFDSAEQRSAEASSTYIIDSDVDKKYVKDAILCTEYGQTLNVPFSVLEDVDEIHDSYLEDFLLFRDMDFFGLASDKFLENGRNVVREYMFDKKVGSQTIRKSKYMKDRVKWLEDIEKCGVFKTTEFIVKYDQKLRQNVRKEIEAIKDGSFYEEM